MRGIKRYYIDMNWEKAKEKYTEVTDAQIRCYMSKLSPFRKNEQGFDSDCAIHCCHSDSCLTIFQDQEMVGNDHLKEIIVPMGHKPRYSDVQLEITVLKED